MSYGLFNLARMTVSSSGTGNITLNAAVTGFLTFDLSGASTASTGQPVTYAINDTTQSEIARGTYYSSSLLLTRGSSTGGMKSTNSNSPINMSNAAQVFITPSANDLNDVFGQCRLTLTSSLVLTLAPFQGNRLTINYTTETIPDAGVAFGSSSLTASTLHYVYAYMSAAGAMTLEASTTARATQAGTGVQIKSGDGTRSLVGMIYTSTTSGAGTFIDTVTQRFVRSWFNSPPITLMNSLSSTRTSTVASFTEISTSTRLEFITFSGEAVRATTNGYVFASAAIGVYTGVAFNGTVGVADAVQVFGTVGACQSATTVKSSVMSEGYNYVSIFGAVPAGGTGSWSADSNANTSISALINSN